MSPRRPSMPSTTEGSGPGGKVVSADIKAKLKQIKGDVDQTTASVKPKLLYAAIAGGTLFVVAAFVLGKRRGRKKSTWVEIRRQ